MSTEAPTSFEHVQDPGYDSWSVTVARAIGMSDEGPREHGMTHLVEHLFARHLGTRDGRTVGQLVGDLGITVTGATYNHHVEWTLSGSAEEGPDDLLAALQAADSWLDPDATTIGDTRLAGEARILQREVDARTVNGQRALFPWTRMLNCLVPRLASDHDGFTDLRYVLAANAATVGSMVDRVRAAPAAIAVVWPFDVPAAALEEAFGMRPGTGAPLVAGGVPAWGRTITEHRVGLSTPLRAEAGQVGSSIKGESRQRAVLAVAAAALNVAAGGVRWRSGMFGPHVDADWGILIGVATGDEPIRADQPSASAIASARIRELRVMDALVENPTSRSALIARHALFGGHVDETRSHIQTVCVAEVAGVCSTFNEVPRGVLRWLPTPQPHQS